MITVLKFKDLQKAWQGMNEYLFIDEKTITDNKAGGAFGAQMVCMDTIVKAKSGKIDEDFDFGEVLGYSRTKWTTLVNNYVNFHYLDMLRSEITRREKTKARMYNYTFHFANKYGSGKDCLISLTVARRPDREKPFASFVIRTSEITKRLIFDFLLVQRILEYLYGYSDFEVHLYAQHWYVTAESFIMYNNVRDIKKLYKKKLGKKEPEKFQAKILSKFEEFYNHPNPQDVMFRVNRRSMVQIQRGPDGKPLSGVKSLKASELTLKEVTNYPDGVITRKQILNYNKHDK
jgi:hypothetical protein